MTMFEVHSCIKASNENFKELVKANEMSANFIVGNNGMIKKFKYREFIKEEKQATMEKEELDFWNDFHQLVN